MFPPQTRDATEGISIIGTTSIGCPKPQSSRTANGWSYVE